MNWRAGEAEYQQNYFSQEIRESELETRNEPLVVLFDGALQLVAIIARKLSSESGWVCLIKVEQSRSPTV